MTHNKHYILSEDILRFINQRKEKISREFEKNEQAEKKTSDPAELVRISRSNQRIFGRQKELSILTGFLTRKSEKEADIEENRPDGTVPET